MRVAIPVSEDCVLSNVTGAMDMLVNQYVLGQKGTCR